MADPYSDVSISGYNANPPDDDGSQTEANRVKYATTKTKIGDPLKDAVEEINTNVAAAFAKVLGGAGITSTSISYAVVESDQGKLVRASVSGVTITTPDATDVDAPFVFCLLNDSTGDITFDGFSTQTIDGDLSVTVPANCGLTVFTDGSNWFTTGQNFQRTQITPQCYLTLLDVATYPTSPMPTATQSAKTTLYCRPDGGNLMPVSDGTNFTVRAFTEMPLGLVSNHVANGIYDVFLFDDSGTLRIGTGPVWNTVTAGSGARGSGAGTTELDLLKGLLVNKVSMTARNGSSTYSVAAKAGLYLGTIFIDGSAGQLTCHVGAGQSRKWGVWNAYNRRKVSLTAAAPSDYTMVGTNTTWRAANNTAANSLTVLAGATEDMVSLQRSAATYINSGGCSVQTGIGVNVTNNPSGSVGQSGGYASGSLNTNMQSAHGFFKFVPSNPGINLITAIEQVVSNSSTLTFAGGEYSNSLSAEWAA